jgi:hypothetical protein
MKALRENINLILSPVALVSFLIAATTYVPPLSPAFKLFLNCAGILSIVLPVAVLIFGLIDILKYRRNGILNVSCILVVSVPWVIVLRLLAQ